MYSSFVRCVECCVARVPNTQPIQQFQSRVRDAVNGLFGELCGIIEQVLVFCVGGRGERIVASAMLHCSTTVARQCGAAHLAGTRVRARLSFVKSVPSARKVEACTR